EDVFFLIVGEDKSRAGENRASIERLIAELNLQTRIRLSGWTDDVREQLSSFALFVSAAREEPFGLVIAEAMACGVPVIATKTEGAREIIEEGVSGEIVPVGNPQRMAQAILDLLDNKEKSSKFVVNGRKRVCENFSLEKMVDETEGFYRRVLAKAVN
ncbi:MAG TPA: glycosyltransferase family 4 protein, partial [Pyrinomonadaceae bacterium]|nr:glycosyltransferase family 4 protein [Pyrinomonadaceae bacterium]